MKRIHELAKEQSVDANDIIDFLKRAGLPASKCAPSSTISEDWERRLMPVMGRLRDKLAREQKAADSASAKGGQGKAATGAGAAAPKATTHAKAVGGAHAPSTPAGKSHGAAVASKEGGK